MESSARADPEARVGRNGKTNENEKKHAPALFQKATEQRMKTLVADSQYSSRKLREQLSAYDVKAVIPYPANQNRNEADVLRVDKYFRTHGPAEEKQIYTLRGAVERVNSRQKEQLCLGRHRARGLQRVTMHALFCMIAMLLNAYAALRLNRPEKARCITMLAR